jgi:hypothetical protein
MTSSKAIANAALTAAVLAYAFGAEADAKDRHASSAAAATANKTVVMDDATRVAEAKASLVGIRDLALDSTADANNFKATIQANRISDVVLERQELNQLRASVNQMAHHLEALDNDRANLAPWETAALNQVTPILQHAASTLTRAIEYSNQNPTWAVSPINLGYANSLEKDMHQIHKTVDEYLNLAKSEQAVKRAEQHLPAPVTE